MADRTVGARLKLYRATQHLKALKHDCGVFMGREPYGISEDLESEGDWQVAHFAVRENPPIEFALVAGDFINNVNAALDHLVYSLSHTKPKGTGFPVSIDPDSYVFTGPKKKRSDRERLLSGVPEPDRAIIDAYQPYENGMQADPLWRMREFANTDKHRVTKPGWARLYGVRVIAPGCDIRVEPCKAGGPFHHGTQLFRFQVSCASGEAKVKVRTEVDMSIGFGPMLVDLVEFDAILARAVDIAACFQPQSVRTAN